MLALFYAGLGGLQEGMNPSPSRSKRYGRIKATLPYFPRLLTGVIRFWLS